MSSSSTDSPSLPSPPPVAPRARWPVRLLRWGLRITFGVWSVLLLVWLTLHWGLLPRVDHWREDIARHASQAIGVPVRIGQIVVRSSGWVPAFELQDVRLLDPQGREALRLPKVSAAISPRSLLTLELRFAQLHLDGAELVIRRERSGRVRVGGMDVGEASVDGSASADWFFAQQEFVVEHGRLLWIDEKSGAAPLPLENVRAVVRNTLRRHDLRLDATPPADWGERFSLRAKLRQPLLARAGDWQRWSGRLYAEWPRVQWAAVQAATRAEWPVPLSLRSAEGGLRAWVDLEPGRWRSATLDLALNDLDLQLGTGLPPLALQRLSARLGAERRDDGWLLRAEQLAFDTVDAQHWPASTLSLGWRQAADPASLPGWPTAEQIRGGEFAADRLDLGVLAALAERLPLPAALRRQLAELAPEGVVEALQGRWSGSPEQPDKYRVKAQGRALALAGLPSSEPGAIGRPGWRGAELSLDADETGGQAQLAIRDGALFLPGVFADPQLPLSEFSGRLVWQIRPARARGATPALPAIELRLQDARFANADAHGDMQLHWKTGPGSADKLGTGQRFPGQLELSGQLQQARASAVARYLPLSLGDAVRHYVAAAVKDGQVPRATFRVQGDLWDFPYAGQREGQFQVNAQVEGVTLDYVPAGPGEPASWPAFQKVSGELVFDRGTMAIRRAKAQLWGIELQDVNGRIADLLNAPELRIEGAGRGPLTDALRFVAATPVGGWTGQALGEASGSGNADLSLALRIPLDHVERSGVTGRVTLAGNEVRLRPDVPPLTQARAQIDFSERGFSIRGASARALGGELSLDGGTEADGAIRIQARGQASAEALRHASELGGVTTLAQALSGQSSYQLRLAFLRGHSELTLDSPLTGMAVELPTPLRKPAAETWPLHLQTRLGSEGGPVAVRDSLQITLGSQLQAEYQRALAADGAKVLRGSIGLGTTAPPLPASGVVAAARLGAVDADTWQAAARSLGGSLAGGPVGSLSGALSAAPGSQDAYRPTDLQLQAQTLKVAGQTLSGLNATVQHRQGGDAGERWLAQLSADQAQGQLEWRPAPTPQRPGRLVARLNRLALSGAGPAAAPSPPPAAEAPAGGKPALPALDIVVADLSWQGRPLGRLELESPGAAADASTWQLNRLSLTRPDAQLSATGHWQAQPQSLTQLDLQLAVQDGGSLLEQMGLGRVVRKGKGEIKGRLAWRGGPLEPRVPTLGGALKVRLGEGQILKVEPGGAGRLLGIVSLQSLPRRLTLDFRDVFQEGFSFDDIEGDVALAEGVAHTNNLRIRGVQAAVLIEGEADVTHETQNLRLVVVPEINAGTASLAYAAINPALGLGTFVAQYLLSKPLQAAGTREFRVSGSWDQPSVEAVERPQPGAEAASGAASGAR